jgi:hypothetical protein
MPDDAPTGAEIERAPAPEPAAPEPTRELTVSDAPTLGIIRAASPDAILEKAATIANALKGLIERQGLAANMGGGRKHVEVGAWQACGTMLGALGGQPLHAETVWTRPVIGDDGVTPRRTTYTATLTRYPKGKGPDKPVEVTTYDVDGLDWEAFVEVKTPDGGVVGSAQGMVGRSESTWAKREDYALRSMAETRAESRAYRRAIGWIVNLAGFSATPQEEMPAAAAEVKEFGPEATDDQQQKLLKALAYLFDTGDGPDDTLAIDAFNTLGLTFNYIPAAIARGIGLAAGRLKRSIDAAKGEPAPASAAPAPKPDEPADAEVVSGDVVQPDPVAAAEAAAIANDVFGGTSE